MSHQHLEGLNQPRPRPSRSRSRSRSARGAMADGLGLEEDESKEDDLSLEASELFEPPKPLSAKKPLLAATLKAMEDSKSKLQQLHVLTNNATTVLEDSKSKLQLHVLNSSTCSGAHLEGMNQPTPRSKSRSRSKSLKEGSSGGFEESENDDDEASLETSALFDPPKIRITKKPLLAATLKALNESKSSKLTNNASTTSLVPTATATATTTTTTTTPTTTPTTTTTTTAATSQQKQQRQEQAQQTNNNNKSSNTMNYNYQPTQKSNKSESTETEQERKKRERKDQKVCEEYNLKTDDTTTMQSNDTPLVNTREESSMFDSPAAAKAAATAMYTATADKMKNMKHHKNKKQGRLYQKKYTVPMTTRSNTTGASANGTTIDRGSKDKDNHQQQQQQQDQCYPGALNIEEMIYGIQMAHLSCTDDSEERLVNASPNALMALEHLVAHPGNGMGTNTDSTIDYQVEDCLDPAATALLPLSQILHDRFHLQLQCIIDESGLRKGRPVDTQGYIASNNDMIILSYRFSTSIFDWITNFSMTSSEWELEHDEELGHAGMCSCFDGVYTKYCTMKEAKPRVHTAYYNNFIYTIPMIRKYIIEPLLDPTTTPKKVYVVGCSLGAAISQLAYCFILQEMVTTLKNPQYTQHRLISVTAGCPRVGDAKFRHVMMDKMNTLKPLNRAVINRIVYNKDIIPHIPPNVLAFCHLDKMVYLMKEGEQLLINPDMSKIYTTFGELQQIYKTVFQKKRESVHENMTTTLKKVQERSQALRMSAASTNSVVENNNEEEASETISVVRITDIDDVGDGNDGEEGGAVAVEEKTTTMAAFELECDGAMEAIHDHMAYWYMTYLEKIRDEQEALFVVSEQQHPTDNNDDTDT